MAFQWECRQCAHKCDLVSDDNCPTCGAPLPTFGAFRADGWPLCPCCGEDELYSRLHWDGQGEHPSLEKYLAAGMGCYRCRWNNFDES
jgi:predicted amidophosphoribosyltransferase